MPQRLPQDAGPGVFAFVCRPGACHKTELGIIPPNEMAGKKSVFARPEIVAAIIAGTVIIVVLTQILPSRREPQAKPPASSETVAPQLQLPRQTGFDATRYISDPGYPWLDDPDRELIALLDERARRTMDALERIQQYEVRKRFIELHNRNIRALRIKRGRLSHDLVSEIRTLLSPFQRPVDPGTTPEDDIQQELSTRRLAREAQKRKESKAETSGVTTPK